MVWLLTQTILALVYTVVSAGQPQDVPKDNVSSSLETVRSLYYEAKFADASELLDQIDLHLSNNGGRVEERKGLRLYQALVEIALTHSDVAKVRFQQLLALDAGFSLNNAEYSPKIISVFDDARKTFDQTRCDTVCTECQAAAKGGDLQKAVEIITPLRLACPCAQKLAKSLANSLAERGNEAFQVQDYVKAVAEFKKALEMDPENQLANQTSAVAETWLEKDLNSALTDWRNNFQSGNYVKAKAAYDRVLSINPDGKSFAAQQIRTQYDTAFETQRQLWARACTQVDPLLTDSIRQEIRSFDPSGDINGDILRRVQTCPTTRCTELPSTAVLERVSSKIFPKVDPAIRPSAKIAVKVRIDDKGKATVIDIDNPEGNRIVSQAVRDAVERWKFDSELATRTPSRCVVTQFFIEFER